ncbi:hypothetical protein [Ferruginibacter sp.]|nr:hypothetical protein [Ferruginibacter sp.]
MKSIFIIVACIITVNTTSAQLKTTNVCPTFKVNVLEGQLNNDLNTKSTAGEIKMLFPCFTEMVEEESAGKCAGIFYKDKDIYFYPARNYIEIRQNFKGQLSLPLLGASRGSLFKWLGYPKIKDVSWDAFQTKYGILILYYNKAAKVNKLQMSSKNTDNIKLCE